MARVHNFAGISPNLPFTEFDFYDFNRKTFKNSEPGRIRKKMPLREMVENLGLTSNRMSLKRGRPSLEKKENDIIHNEPARVMATRMEGSFGTQKEHYSLKRIKVRRKLTRSLYIFSGIHTTNVVRLVRRGSLRKCSGSLIFHVWNDKDQHCASCWEYDPVGKDWKSECISWPRYPYCHAFKKYTTTCPNGCENY